MKTTLDINDELLIRAKNHARRIGKPLRAVVEDSLRQALDSAQRPEAYEMPDRSVGEAGADDPLERMTWQDLRDEIYGTVERR